MLQVAFNSATQPAIGLSLLCLLLDVCKQLYEEELVGSSKSMVFPYLTVNHRYFYDGSFGYGNIDRVGGVLSHLNKLYRLELSNALGSNHEFFTRRSSEPSNFFRDICKYIKQSNSSI